jgi:2-keto-4-pentenoate hydratase/2-oxohepta-3-ene-1,7-dioic acid hydratase in catechol pathway
MVTKVDGEVRQDTGIDDLIFNCAYLISYLSQGSTLKKGTVIMTGTPGGKITQILKSNSRQIVNHSIGVGFGMKPPRWLQPGNVVEITISKIGTLRNPVEFE